MMSVASCMYKEITELYIYVIIVKKIFYKNIYAK
jgi:hypothetical protein